MAKGGPKLDNFGFTTLLNRMRPVFRIALLLCAAQFAFGQSKLNRLSPVINHPAVNVSAPFVSLDGNSLLFVSDDAEDNVLTVFYSTRPDGVNWREPAALPKYVSSRLNFLRGFGLTPDGKQAYVSTMKSGGLGGYDLFVSDLRGAVWTEPMNVGMPVNSMNHEACPSFTPDGLTMYFMRCARMDPNKADGCKILVSRRRTLNDRWGPPEELPAFINTGNSQSPRIMGDSETLIFSSSLLTPNQGGMDLYMSRLSGTTWSKPIPLDFVNSPGDEQFVSGTSLGRYLMKDAPGKSKNEIIEVLFPPEVKPKGVMKVEGKVILAENPAGAYISLFDKSNQVRLQNLRPNREGAFTLFLKEGINYRLQVDPEQDVYTFYARDFDLTQGKFSTFERVTVELKKPVAGDALELQNTSFKKYSSELDPSSDTELKKLVRLMNGNPTLNFSVEVSLVGYRMDSVQRDLDLTEVLTDTLHIPVTRTVADSTSADSTEWVLTETIDSVVVKHRYHNDRTPQMVLELVNYLTSQGIAAGRLTPVHRAQPAALPEERKTIVRIVVR